MLEAIFCVLFELVSHGIAGLPGLRKKLRVSRRALAGN